MAFVRQGIEPEVQERLREMAASMRELLYGEAGCPEWGTKFREIEQQGMSVGLELARLVMEQTVDEQARQMPDEALVVEGDEVQPAGRKPTPLETEAGPVEWDQPCGHLKQGRKAFFPSQEGAGPES